MVHFGVISDSAFWGRGIDFVHTWGDIPYLGNRKAYRLNFGIFWGP